MDCAPELSTPNDTQQVREQISLDGAWDFRHETQSKWHQAMVPQAWQVCFDALRMASGNATYRTEFKLPPHWKTREISLCFGAVNYFARVVLNGEEIGTHEGGYLPFGFVLDPGRLQAANELVVHVTLPDGDEQKYADFPFGEIPHGKQSWYGPLGGIWQSVYLEARSPLHIRHCQAKSDLATGQVTFNIKLSKSDPCRLLVDIFAPSGEIVAAQTFDAHGIELAAELNISAPQAWSPDTPNLYRIRARLFANDTNFDDISISFGFRTFEKRNGKFYLNGKPFYMRGALDQDYYPQGSGTPPSTSFLEDQFKKAKALGLNTLRCHIKVPDPRYYEVADRLGMLIWSEIPNVDVLTPRSKRLLRQTMTGILERDGGHPSIVAWTIINEDWGTRLVDEKDHRRWLIDEFDALKMADPGRLVVDNSPCVPNFHLKTDINDFHYYRSVPERREEWDMLTKEFAAGAHWTFSPDDDAIRSGDEPLVVSEFGVWGLPHPEDLKTDAGADPWWFEYGSSWGEGTALPHGMESRYFQLRLNQVFASFRDFIDAAQWHQFENLKYQIQSIRRHEPIAGYVLTQLTDVHWEANGLMDMERNLRVFGQCLSEINADIVILPVLERWAWWAKEQLDLSIVIATGGHKLPDGCTLEWSISDTDILGSTPVESQGANRVGAPLHAPIALPAVHAAQMMNLRFCLKGPTDEVLGGNSVRIALHPQRPGNAQRPSVASDDPELLDRLKVLGYNIAKDGQSDVFVTRNLSKQRVGQIHNGQRVLLLADCAPASNTSLRSDLPPREPPSGAPETAGTTAQGAFPGYRVLARDQTLWRGDWITNFSWLKRNGTFSQIPGGPMLDLSFDRIVPRAVLDGFRPWDFEGRVHAGVVVGWLHKPAATIFEKTHGLGKLVTTTFRLTQDPPLKDPTATALLDALIKLCSD